ncbi:MAG: hypothetical protein E7254_02660 [Lachnospiraceae bacterium]|nr:hypothetical protein [Lachnospiraceae bacterium]
MHEYLLLVYENDENGNKKNGVEPQYFEFDNKLKLRAKYSYFRNMYQTTTNPETGEVVTTGIKAYTVELSQCRYKTMSKADADAFIASIVES